MKLIGNFAECIKNEWVEEILSLPKQWPRPFCEGSPEHKRLEDAGYDLSTSHWAVIDPQDVNFKIDFPFLTGEWEWWIARLLPGQYMPMHIDPHPKEKTGKFYWIPLQDYISGHVFIIKDNFIKDYKKGDAFIFDNLADLHGSANIGMIPKITLLVSVYD
jgi:hypothetical protein